MSPDLRRTERRVDLDWIRIAAFVSLILYHIGMVFVPWYYHVKSTHLLPELEPVMLALNPWRLSLLFFVAGTATRFMTANKTPSALLKSRSVRLLLPLLLGIILIVPPQPYWEVVSRNLYSGDFLSFYSTRYFAFAALYCDQGRCIVLPTWNHLWFIAYLWVYTAAFMLLLALLPSAVRLIERACEGLLCGLWLLVLPAIVLVAYRLFLFPHFPQTNALVGDWYNHALYGSIFVLGFLIASSQTFWIEAVRWRWVSFGIATAVFVSFLIVRFYMPLGQEVAFILKIYAPVAYGVYQWCSIVTVLGFGRRWLTRDSAMRRYLTDAIFPYYIVHQTVIVGVAFALRDAGLSAATEATTIMATTAAACAMSYEIVKRVFWLRPIFGLKSQRTLA